jgi:transposase
VAYAPRHGEQKIPHGSVRRRMALHQPTSSRAHRTRTPQASRLASDPRRRLLRAQKRLPLAVAAEGLPSLEDRLRLVQEMAHRVGTWERLRTPSCASSCGCALAGTREPQSAAIVDSQSVRTTGVGGTQRGFDPAKKVEGRKRHLLVDTEGLVLKAKIHSARIPDEDGIRLLMDPVRGRLSRLSHLWVDAGYQGRGKRWVEEVMGLSVEVVRKPRESRCSRKTWQSAGLRSGPRKA